MTKIILIRHGESLGNIQKIFLGHTDWDLTERGYEQAKKMARYIDNFDIDVIYASDLKRAYNTAKEVAKRRNMDIIKTKEFREIFAGEWEGKSYAELDEKYPEARKCWGEDIGNAVCTGGESVKELQNRVVKEFYRIAEENKGKTILIGTHATPIRMIKCHVLGKKTEEAKDIPWALNASATIIDVEKNEIILDGYAEYLGDFLVAPSAKM